MKLYKFILFISLLSISCEVDNIGPIFDGEEVIFFDQQSFSVAENITSDVVIRVGSTVSNGMTSRVTLGGTAVDGIHYSLNGDLDLNFSDGVFIETITISIIDNDIINEDVEIVMSLPEGQGFSENEGGELTITIINDELTSGTVVVPVISTNDDAEEGINGSSPGAMEALDSSDLEFGETEGGSSGVQAIGLRFNKINIPNGAIITSASIQFTADEDVDNPADVVLTIFGENVDNSSTFDATDSNISNRPLTTEGVDWSIPIWTTVGEAGSNQKTPDIKSVIQEIVNRPGWKASNSIGIIFIPTVATLSNPVESGRVAESFDGTDGGEDAPVISISWELVL